MTVNARIEAALAAIGCPIGAQQLDDGAYVNTFPSVTYSCTLDQPEGWAEDVPTENGWYFQVDIWSKTNYLALAETIKAAMRAADFGYLGSGPEITSSDGLVYHKPLRFKYTEFL